MHNLNWDNLRYVLAVADNGSVSAAARNLGVNHATVLRRVAAFEDDFGAAVFDKTATGYRLFPDRIALLEAVRDVESSILSVQRLMRGSKTSLRGVVRIASTDSICLLLLPDISSKLQSEFSELQIEVLSDNGHLDFARMQADIFVRPTPSLPEDMVGDKACDLEFRAYSTLDAPDKWLTLLGPLSGSVAATWLSENVPKEHMSAGSNSFLVLREMARLGMGISILPRFVGEDAPMLIHQVDKMPALKVPIWVGSHADLSDAPRIRTVRKRIVECLKETYQTG